MADSFGLQVPTVKVTYLELSKMNQSFLEQVSEPQSLGFFDDVKDCALLRGSQLL
jgi:hypothetical protein